MVATLYSMAETSSLLVNDSSLGDGDDDGYEEWWWTFLWPQNDGQLYQVPSQKYQVRRSINSEEIQELEKRQEVSEEIQEVSEE